MKKVILALLIIFLSGFNGITQEKTLSLKDAVSGNNQHMYPNTLHQLAWRGGSNYYTYVENNELFQESADKTLKKSILDLEEINKILKKSGYRDLADFPDLTWYNENAIQFTYDTSILIINLKSKKIESSINYSKLAENIDFCKKNNSIAYTIKNNLFITNNEGKTVQVTTEGNENIIYAGNYVHRTEFGIQKGSFWSYNGNYIAFYRQDISMVTNYPLVNITTRIAEVENIKYPMAGMKSEEVTIGIYSLESGKTVFLKTGEPKEQYLTNIAWNPDENSIFVAVLNRDQNHLKLNQYDIKSGELIKTLFEEKHEKYVEPEEPIHFIPGNNNQFVWFSQRDGFNHIYLYKLNGELIKQLTEGNWVVTDLVGFDHNGEFMYYVSNERSPIERDVYKIKLSNGEKTILTQAKGTHNPLFSVNKTFFIDHYSSLEVPGDYYLVNNSGINLRTIYKAENPFKEYKIGEMSIFTIKADDGQDLFVRMIKPVDFDPAKIYPAIVYVYGGPHSQLIRNKWMGNSRIWQYYMAQKGYVMLTIDNRGTANRGFDFENCIHRQLGKLEIEDQKKGIDFLFNLDYIDTARIGIHGWSYGGFLTISLMQNYSEIYKVGVAGGPVIDWKYYEIMYGERYMDTPQENPEGYKSTRLTDKVSKLKGKLLIIHGAVDETVVWQHSLDYINNCIKEGKPVDYFVYPRHKHNVRGKDRIHLMEKVTQYFDDYL